MPYLVIGRHAKADRPPVDDFDRPLTDGGFAEAARLGEFLTDYPLDCLISSAALRTMQTAQGVADAFAQAGTPLEVRADRALYDSDVDDWVEVISTVPADSTGAYIVGHEPTVSEVITELCADFELETKFRPSSIAVFDLPAWGVAAGGFPQPEIHCFRD